MAQQNFRSKLEELLPHEMRICKSSRITPDSWNVGVKKKGAEGRPGRGLW